MAFKRMFTDTVEKNGENSGVLSHTQPLGFYSLTFLHPNNLILKHEINPAMNNNETYKGIVHGSIVELQQSPNIPDGIEVDVIIRQSEPTTKQRQDRLKALFGSCKEDADDLDSYMKWNDGQRKLNRPRNEQ